MDFPLESIHKLAFKAAQAARCAGEQGKYWEMHDQLFANQKTLDAWMNHAEAVGLNAAQFDTCLNSGKYDGEIRKDLAMAQGAGLTGTPAFFLAVTDPTSTKVKTARALRGAQPYEAFKSAIDACAGRAGRQEDSIARSRLQLNCDCKVSIPSEAITGRRPSNP